MANFEQQNLKAAKELVAMWEEFKQEIKDDKDGIFAYYREILERDCKGGASWIDSIFN